MYRGINLHQCLLELQSPLLVSVIVLNVAKQAAYHAEFHHFMTD
jgi:hypothetical protein